MPKDKGNGGDNVVVTDLQPLTPKERMSWNKLLRFIHKEGFTGDTALDNRDKNMGKELIAKYNAAHADDTISYDIVPRVQSDFQYFRMHGYFPGYGGPDADSFKKYIGSVVRNKEFSPVDSWLGSLTSQEAYPEITDNQGHMWGTNYSAFLTHMGNKYGTQ
ncbi:MAG: hypothetical protein ACREHG_08195 [Candidatus Saccharimonadales bacterium]